MRENRKRLSGIEAKRLDRLSASGVELRFLEWTFGIPASGLEALLDDLRRGYRIAPLDPEPDETAEREGAGLPPYRRLGLFRAYGGDAAAVAQAAGTARFLAQQQMGKQVSLMDLVAVAQPKGACTQFLLSFAKREASLEHIRSWQGELAANLKSRAVRWSFELDPQSW